MAVNQKIWITALRSMPEHLIDDATQFAVFRDRVYAAHPNFPPMVYDVTLATWSEIDFSQPPDKLMPRYNEFIKRVEEQS